MIPNLWRQNEGATAIEYGLIVGLLSLGMLASLVGVKSSLNADYSGISSGMNTAVNPTSFVANPSNPRSAYWTAKGITSGPTYANSVSNSTNTWTTNFSDGSYVKYTQSTFQKNYSNINYYDAATGDTVLIGYDGSVFRDFSFNNPTAIPGAPTMKMYLAPPQYGSVSNGSITSVYIPDTRQTVNPPATMQADYKNMVNDLSLFAGNATIPTK